MRPEHLLSAPILANPAADSIVEEIHCWIHSYQLDSLVNVHRLRLASIPGMVALTQPYVSSKELLVVTQWCIWLFIRDDLLDNRNRGGSYVERMGDQRLRRSLQSILASVRDMIDPLWCQQYCFYVDEYTAASLVERQWHSPPPFGEYMENRRKTGAVRTCLALAMAMDRIPMLGDLDLLDLANDHIVLVNDIFSLAKELKEGHPSNSIISLGIHDGMSQEAAISALTRRCNELYDAVRNLEHPYRDTMLNWINGHVSWYSLTERYTLPAFQMSS